ncbi:alpha/beta fold hydrolase [Pseudonocardia nigra]|uniref:alpha/beta fold hydrolase n=1 Tax=Pseudonocardia nigra TaxID=1921578 RepID=UPI001FE7E676|nr:alpha/beta hydrolase [Pseudonocardia nigra]
MMERQQTIDGEPVRWLEHGEGSPVVLVHGIPTSPQLWRHVMSMVQGRCLALEMRGYGAGIANGEGRDLGLAAQAQRLLRWLDAVEVESPVLVGHDLGGGVAQIATVHAPHRFAGLVLTNAVCYDSWPIPSVKAMQRGAPVLRHLPEVALYPTFMQLLHRGHDDRARALESIGVHWRHYVAHGAARSLMRQVSALDMQDTLAVADRLPTLRLPAHVVWGAADRFQKIGYGQRLAADLAARPARCRRRRGDAPPGPPRRVAGAAGAGRRRRRPADEPDRRTRTADPAGRPPTSPPGSGRRAASQEATATGSAD